MHRWRRISPGLGRAPLAPLALMLVLLALSLWGCATRPEPGAIALVPTLPLPERCPRLPMMASDLPGGDASEVAVDMDAEAIDRLYQDCAMRLDRLLDALEAAR